MKISKEIIQAGPGRMQEPISDGHDSQRIWHKGRYIEYYRYVFAEALGIDPDDLPDSMYIHHIDGDRMNNELDNLMLCTKKAHENLETLINPKKYCIKD